MKIVERSVSGTVPTGEDSGLTMVRFTPETVVVRDQSYKPTRWARERPRGQEPESDAAPDRGGV